MKRHNAVDSKTLKSQITENTVKPSCLRN